MARARNRTKDQPNPDEFIGCVVKQLPSEMLEEAARVAIDENPANYPPLAALAVNLSTALVERFGIKKDVSPAQKVAILTSKWWGPKGARLGVYFTDTSDSSLKNRILAHMNAWGQNGLANVKFLEASAGTAQVRIARERSGYWSYLGVDILSIPRNQQTMNLQAFSMSTPESEYLRVVRHETGHTLGMPHEHMRADIIRKLDVQKTIAYFRQNQGWSEEETRAQVLTPLNEASLRQPTPADETSIMTYQLPGSITKDGQPIRGGSDINAQDAAYCVRQYPGESGPVEPPPPPPPTGGTSLVLSGTLTLANARFVGEIKNG